MRHLVALVTISSTQRVLFLIKHLLIDLEGAFIEHSSLRVSIDHDQATLVAVWQRIACCAGLERPAEVRGIEHVSTLHLRRLLHIEVHPLFRLLQQRFILKVC